MNERIQELLYKANGQYHGISALTGKEIINTEFVDYAKFAELIVRECKDLLFESSENNRLPIAVDDMAHIIDTHFGVEE